MSLKPIILADDGQSDIEVDQDRSIDLVEYSDANESVATNVGDLDYNLDLEVDEHSDNANESDTDSDDNLPTNAGDNDPRCRDGWSFDCAGASLNVRDFIEPTGPTFDLGLDAKPIEYFFQLIPESFFETFRDQTHLYAHQREQEKDPNWTVERSKWKSTTVPELKAYIAIIMYMGICDLPNYRLYWSDGIMNQPFVSNIMIRNRYEDLSSYVHMADRTANPVRGQEGHDVLHKVRPILDIVKKTWAESMNLSKNLCVDEAMVKFKGRCHFLQYLPAKPTKWGLKVWALCDSESYYMASMRVYTGKNNNPEPEDQPVTLTGLGEKVVVNLVAPYLNKHHFIFMDNYFTSLALLQYLESKDTYACGTIRNNRIGLPNYMKKKNVVKKSGDIVRMMKGNIQVVAWHDKRKVMVATTGHNAEDGIVSRGHGRTAKEYPRPVAIEDYSKNYCGVDKSDQLRSYYGIAIKAVKWWKQIFFFVLTSVS